MAEQDFTALWCERSHHYIIDVPALDVANITAVLPGRCSAGVVVAAAQQLCDVAVAAATAAPVHPQRVTGHPVEPDTRRTAGTYKRDREIYCVIKQIDDRVQRQLEKEAVT